MLCPIACTSCGKQLGDIAPIYFNIRRDRMLKMYKEMEYTVMPSHLMAVSRDTANLMADILDGLKIDKCCRTHLISTVLFSDHY
jgi:DNA-directed RNA polymerase subunit N (RpoN/RPB10)